MNKKYLKHIFWIIIILFLIYIIFFTTQKTSKLENLNSKLLILSAEEIIGKYKLANPLCLSVDIESTEGYLDSEAVITVREKHGFFDWYSGKVIEKSENSDHSIYCEGDPNVSSFMFNIKINRSTGEVFVGKVNVNSEVIEWNAVPLDNYERSAMKLNLSDLKKEIILMINSVNNHTEKNVNEFWKKLNSYYWVYLRRSPDDHVFNDYFDKNSILWNNGCFGIPEGWCRE